MASFNRVILMGNLTRDPSVRQLQSNTAVAEFGLAVNRRYKTAGGEEKDEVTFVDCTAFGRTAEVIGQHFTKGRPIHLEGRLKWDTWQDRGGDTRSKLTVVVESFQFVGGKRDDDAPDETDQRAAAAGLPNRRQQPVNHRGPMEKTGAMFRTPTGKPQQASVTQPFGDESHFKPDDLPF